MDKDCKDSFPEYSRDRQTLRIERRFSGTQTVQDLIAQYLLEQSPKLIPKNTTKNAGGQSGNWTAGAPAEEDGP